MDELITRLTAAASLDADTARTAVGIILGFLRKEGPPTEVEQLVAALPGSEEAIADADGASGGMMGGLASMVGGGGGIMALGGKLMAAGLSMGQIQTLGKEMFAYGRETAGEDVMGPIIGSVPGLSQFV